MRLVLRRVHFENTACVLRLVRELAACVHACHFRSDEKRLILKRVYVWMHKSEYTRVRMRMFLRVQMRLLVCMFSACASVYVCVLMHVLVPESVYV